MASLKYVLIKNRQLLRGLNYIKNSHRFTSTKEDERVSKGVVIGMYEIEKEQNPNSKPLLTTQGEKLDKKVQGKLTELIKESGITGILGKGKVFNNLDPEFSSVAVIGLGKEGLGFSSSEGLDQGMENARVGAGMGCKKLREQGCTHIYVDGMEYAEQAAEGGALSIWRYQDNKIKEKRKSNPKLELYGSDDDQDAWTRGLFKAEAQNLARRLCDTPANQMTPTNFAQATVDALCPCGVNVEVRNMNWIEAQNMHSFLAVARSSCEPPIFLELSYCGAKQDDKPILLVGKGITFNSGGLCLKDSENMSEYRASMAGAAVVVAAMRGASALSLPINITAVIPLCENMPSGMSFKPGDVIQSLNGKSIAVHDTNNAGVLLLADTFTYGQNVFKPKLVVDVATLTGGVRTALGGSAAGVFSNSDFVWNQMKKAGALTGDRVWRLPLWNYYTKQVADCQSYDISNRGHGKGSSCLAAAFLKEFIPCVDWIHMDITGVGMSTESGNFPYLEKGRMTGRPTRTLIQFLYQMACPEESSKDLQ